MDIVMDMMSSSLTGCAFWITSHVVVSLQTLYNEGHPPWGQQHTQVLLPMVAARWTLFNEDYLSWWQGHMVELLPVVAVYWGCRMWLQFCSPYFIWHMSGPSGYDASPSSSLAPDARNSTHITTAVYEAAITVVFPFRGARGLLRKLVLHASSNHARPQLASPLARQHHSRHSPTCAGSNISPPHPPLRF